MLDKNPADEQIRAALRRDDPAAVELIWDRYGARLLALLQATLCSRSDAEDVLQTTFVRIARKRCYLAEARCLDAYVYQMAQNEAISFLRRRRLHRREQAAPVDAVPWLVATENSNGQSEMAEELQKALARLPQVQREVVVLKVYGDRTFQEIAQTLELSRHTVASRYRYAMEKLRALLRDFLS
jgi:RNA polymerase sigma-70 factor (ECF subfamily)